MHPNYISMIMPAKWYGGGRGLDDFRKMMLNEKYILTTLKISLIQRQFFQRQISVAEYVFSDGQKNTIVMLLCL